MERDATAALIGLMNVPCCPSFHDNDRSNVEFLDADPSGYCNRNDPVSALGIIEVPVLDKEQFFGISVSSACTNPSSDAPDAPDIATDTDPSDESLEHQSDILPSSCDTALGKKRVAERNAKSGIWKFFEIYKDPKIQNLAFCLLCKTNINYTFTLSTGILT